MTLARQPPPSFTRLIQTTASSSPSAIIDSMSDSVIVRRLPPGVKQGLRERAAAHGRSVEAEVRQILVDIVLPHRDFVLEWIEGGADLPDGPDFEAPERESGRESVSFE